MAFVQGVRSSDVKLSYWLTLCVLLFYQQTADMVIGAHVRALLGFPGDLPEWEFGPDIDPLNPQCADFEVFNGVDCVCASDVTATCTDQGGMVCDNTGARYKSACAFALAICTETIPHNRRIQSCGFCTSLRLVSGHDDQTVATFTKTGPPAGGTDVEYWSHTDNLLLFYSSDLSAWAVGRRLETGTVVAMRQVKSSAYPQDNASGMVVATQQGDEIQWQVDPFMRFECVQALSGIETPNAYNYHHVGMDLGDVRSLFFGVQACDDAHVLLMATPGDEENDIIEIVIGGWGNTHSVIRTIKQQRPPVAKAKHRPLDCHNPRHFWISWKDGVFEVGTGQTVGTGRFMTYNSGTTPTVRAFAISTGFGATGKWTLGDATQTRRHKRFLFTTFVLVALAVTAVDTGLTIAQHAKGCLYYPSVCTLRDRIRDRLQPEVTNLRDKFISTYGDPGEFKVYVDKIQHQSEDTREKLAKVRELHSEFKLRLSEITDVTSSIPDDIAEFKGVLLNYKNWMNGVEFQFALKVGGSGSAVSGSIYALLTYTAENTWMLAGAGLAALAAVGLAAADIVSNVKAEKQVRDQLRETESKYMKVKSDLDTAFTSIKAFQKNFCTTAIAFFRDVSSKGKAYHKTFQSLYSYIAQNYGESINDCSTKYGYTKLETLAHLSDNLLQPLLKFLDKDIVELRTKIDGMNETNRYFSTITEMVKQDEMSPIAIFRAITAEKPEFIGDTFSDLWDLLLFIAKKVLPATDCYQGYNLGFIRAGIMTKDNYEQHDVCYSEDIKTDVTMITDGVYSGRAPCRMFQDVQSAGFRSRYSVIKYIADHILSDSRCYWGYDLESVRKDVSDVHDLREIDTADINRQLFSTLYYIRDSNDGSMEEMLEFGRKALCNDYHVCSTTWQTFIMCEAWKGHVSIEILGCNTRRVADRTPLCIPDDGHSYETCSTTAMASDPHRPYIK